MLTPEEERQRAIKINKLYGKPLERKSESAVDEAFRPGFIMGMGIILALPFIITNAFLNFYLQGYYSSIADMKGASIAFVVGFILFSGLSILFLKYCRDSLYSNYSTGRFVFIFSLIILTPTLFYLSSLVRGEAPQSLDEIAIRAAIFAALAIIAAGCCISFLVILSTKYLKNR